MSSKNVHIAVVGYMNSGKSTLVNSLFGVECSNMNLGRSTFTILNFQESHKVDHANFFNVANELNSKAEQEPPICGYFSRQSTRNVKFQEPINVPQSVAIPKKSVNDNNFSVYDFPGLDDKDYVSVANIITNNLSKFDYLFYVLDASNDINSLHFNTSFRNFMKDIGKFQITQNEKAFKVILIINKCDGIGINGSALKNLGILCKGLEEILIESRVKWWQFYKISALHLLIEYCLNNNQTVIEDDLKQGKDFFNTFASTYLGAGEIQKYRSIQDYKGLINVIYTKYKEEKENKVANDGPMEQEKFMQFLRHLRDPNCLTVNIIEVHLPYLTTSYVSMNKYEIDKILEYYQFILKHSEYFNTKSKIDYENRICNKFQDAESIELIKHIIFSYYKKVYSLSYTENSIKQIILLKYITKLTQNMPILKNLLDDIENIDFQYLIMSNIKDMINYKLLSREDIEILLKCLSYLKENEEYKFEILKNMLLAYPYCKDHYTRPDSPLHLSSINVSYIGLISYYFSHEQIQNIFTYDEYEELLTKTAQRKDSVLKSILINLRDTSLRIIKHKNEK